MQSKNCTKACSVTRSVDLVNPAFTRAYLVPVRRLFRSAFRDWRSLDSHCELLNDAAAMKNVENTSAILLLGRESIPFVLAISIIF